uniref:Uncharacterized protein n=1 Tax=Arundo donax TaxID=35708 RepID=A0A0A9F8Z2_ARUDO
MQCSKSQKGTLTKFISYSLRARKGYKINQNTRSVIITAPAFVWKQECII